MQKQKTAATWICTTQTQPWVTKKATAKSSASPGLELTGQTHQTIEGFGGCFNEMGWERLLLLSESRRAKLLSELFHPLSGCRFNLCRLPIGANDYALQWYSHCEHEGDFSMEKFSVERDEVYLLPYIRAALALRPDMELFASPWSPPAWMKRPAVYNYGTFVWEKKYLEAYALYFQKFVEAYRSRGVTIDQVHVQNEPTADQKFPSCVWTGEQMRDFIRDHLGPQFEKSKTACEIWLGTINSDNYNKFANVVLSDEKARKFISGVGYQWAGKQAIQRTHETWPELRLMQTENECGEGKNTWEHAHYVFDLIRHYFGNGANAYVYWNMILPPVGKSTWGWPQNAMVTIDDSAKVTINPEFYVMKHFSHFVLPGAKRLGLKGPWSGNALAFENGDGSVVVVAANPLGEKRELKLSVKGAEIRAEIPAESFNTFVVYDSVH